MKLKTHLLWIDGIGALIVGTLVVLLHDWLSALHGLPPKLVLAIGIVNLIYGSYSTPLAMRARRPLPFILFLVFANGMWTLVCMVLAITFRETITVWGLLHVVGEGLYVGGLASLEWRWRVFLQKR